MKLAGSVVSVDIFVCANSYVDVATVGMMAHFTGGQIYHYESFNAAKDGEALRSDIYHNLMRPTGFDGAMIVR